MAGGGGRPCRVLRACGAHERAGDGEERREHVFYALVVLMNAPAMEKNAENMDYGVARDATKALVRPVARLSAMFRLDFLRRGAARLRGRWLDQEDSSQQKNMQ